MFINIVLFVVNFNYIRKDTKYIFRILKKKVINF
jgi:hypothetical protein